MHIIWCEKCKKSKQLRRYFRHNSTTKQAEGLTDSGLWEFYMQFRTMAEIGIPVGHNRQSNAKDFEIVTHKTTPP